MNSKFRSIRENEPTDESSSTSTSTTTTTTNVDASSHATNENSSTNTTTTTNHSTQIDPEVFCHSILLMFSHITFHQYCFSFVL